MNISENERNLPIGVQSFEKLRKDGCVYVDKTAYIYKLLQTSAPYFLSRPRRFGKSLLLSTLKAYFEGKKELFEGLAITELCMNDPDAFAEYPVFYFDFNGAVYSHPVETSLETERRISSVIYDNMTEIDADDPGLTHPGTEDTIRDRNKDGNIRFVLPVELVLDEHLRRWEKEYGADPENISLPSRFRYLLRKAVEQTGRRAVVLVDEYDKSLQEADKRLDELNRLAYKGFFGTLKSEDEYLKFILITGVTKFSKVSIFSDLNQLRDISLDRMYSDICGITEAEMKDNFGPEIENLAASQGMNIDECLSELRRMYDGYHFYQNTEGVYNPFSLLNAFSSGEFDHKWFESGTPTLLIHKLARTGFDPKRITDGSLCETRTALSDYRTDDPDPIPLLYQTGYLTISAYDKRFKSYILDYPNDEVRYGFLNCLAPMMLHREKERSPLEIQSFVRDIEAGDTDRLMRRFTSLFADLPYLEADSGHVDSYLERDFQNVIYITFMLLGQYIRTEVHNATGRADAIAETAEYIYLFEFKRDKTAAEALEQIIDMGYDRQYAADSRKLIRVGVNFSSSTRNIDGWITG